MTDGKAVTIAVTMSGDGRRYRECQAGHREAVGAFDLLAAAYDRLLQFITNGGTNGK